MLSVILVTAILSGARAQTTQSTQSTQSTQIIQSSMPDGGQMTSATVTSAQSICCADCTCGGSGCPVFVQGTFLAEGVLADLPGVCAECAIEVQYEVLSQGAVLAAVVDSENMVNITVTHEEQGSCGYIYIEVSSGEHPSVSVDFTCDNWCVINYGVYLHSITLPGGSLDDTTATLDTSWREVTTSWQEVNTNSSFIYATETHPPPQNTTLTEGSPSAELSSVGQTDEQPNNSGKPAIVAGLLAIMLC